MCARIIQTTEVQLLKGIYEIETDNAIERPPTWNGTPGTFYNVVREQETGRDIAGMRWGLIPRDKYQSTFAPANARSETVHWKQTFREAFAHRRCVFPVNGWYEWQKRNGAKIPHLIDREDGGIVHLAAIWETWTSGDGIDGFAVLTTEPRLGIAAVHDRQPTVLDLEQAQEWLCRRTGPNRLRELAGQQGAEPFRIRRVSRAVNNRRNDSPELLATAS